MSQIYRSTVSSGGLPPDVATQYNTDDGNNAVPALNILIVSGNDTTDNDTDGLRTVSNGTDGALANEVRVELTNRLQGTATSTNASNADIITFALDASNPMVYRFKFDISGRSTAGNFVGEGVGYTVFASARTDGVATATIIGDPFMDADEDTNLMGATIDLIASGNNVILRAVGIAAETINYSAVGYYVVV